MSPVDNSPTSESPPCELWAGKSRNAKAQARHRAKRKAYIEQLEQTVSKLQTALALSGEDVADLPTAQAKLRELKEENDSLRAQLRKLQSQPPPPAAPSSYTLPSRVPKQMHSPASSEDYHRESKRRKMSPPAMEDYVSTNLSYLGSADSMLDSMSVPHLSPADMRQTAHLLPPMPLPKACYQQANSNPQLSPIDSQMHMSQEAALTLSSFSSHQNNAAASWSFPSAPHQRQRSSSGSSSSSESGPPYLTPSQMSLAASCKPTAFIDDGVSYDVPPKVEDGYHYARGSNIAASYDLPNGLPMSAFEPIVVPPGPSENNAWTANSWTYSDVRTH